MNRYLPTIARPIVAAVGRSEVIACGLMLPHESQPVIMYNPASQKGHYFINHGRGKLPQPVGERTKVIGNLIVYQKMLRAQQNDIYQVIAQDTTTTHVRRSPNITIKMRTDQRNELLQVDQDNNVVRLQWNAVADEYSAMIYFVALEDSAGNGLFGVYTREAQLHIPALTEMALLLPGMDRELQQKQHYTAHLFVVDYDGWVPVRSSVEFRYSAEHATMK